MTEAVGSLDVEPFWSHATRVKTLLLLLISTLTASSQQREGALVKVPLRNIVPMEVKQRAQKAVQVVVDKTIRGDFKAALDSMNPKFVNVLSRPYGGPKKYKAGLLKQIEDMGKNGVTFEAAITQPADTAFEVDYGFENQMVDGQVVMGKDGKPVQIACYRSWMVFVPTVKDFQYLDKSSEPHKLRKFRKWDFEVAISLKKNENWTFINGSSVNALQLRTLFHFLPKEDKKLQFPVVKAEERKK
ncbi:MAG: hypothetical protein OSB05_09140 [Akkermansiaceae bacterium]|nr:hypothetical protein [Akkermansiaceae bacterium]